MKAHQQYRRKDRLVFSHPPTPITTSFSCPSPYYSAGSSPSSAEAKRLKLQRDFDNGFVDTEPFNFDFPVMSHAAPRTLPIPPHINLHRASEPASPVTIATTISSHSTPSPSPSGVIIMSDNDSQFFDDGYPVVVDQKQRIQHRRHTVEPSYASNTPSATRNQFSHNSFPIVMSQSESPYSQHALNPFQAVFPADQSGTLDFSKLSQQHHQQQFLQAPMQEYMGGSPGDHTMGTMQQQCHSDEEELPALSPTGNRNHHYPQSSRPSISENGLQSPTTPTTSPERNSANICGASVPGVSEDTFDFIGAWMDEYLHPDSEIHTPIPKLGRTVSDAMQDELFNPGIAPGMARTTPKRTVESRGPSSTFPNLFQQAQTQHAIARTASENPPINREHSPFRANSPFHPARHPFPPSPSRQTGLLPVVGFTARSQREQREKQDAAHALIFQMQGEYKNGINSPKTISPKDAYLDYNENAEDEGVKGSLFASQEDSYSQNDSQNESSCCGGGSFSGSAHDEDEDIKTEQSFGLKTEESFGSMATSRRDSDVNMSFSTPIFTDNGNQFANFQATNYGYSGMTSEERSDDSQAVEEDDDESEYRSPQSPTPKKPVDSKANSGAYTCASPGCSQRFTTATKMQKHRREAHGQTSPVSRDGMTSNVKAHHPGPHRCFRINPTTNKPCNTIFSRPYDLTRHEDTIHNTTREKVRCEICNDEKTFSRQDALTRHKKVKHGIDK